MIVFEPATDGNAVFAIGNSMYTGTLGGQTPAQLTLRQTLTNFGRAARLIDFVGSDGDRFIYVCGGGSPNPEYFRSSDGVTWTTASAIASSGILILTDMIVWDRQLIALETTGKRIISSADGQNWSVDAGADEIYRTKERSRSGDVFIGIAMAPWGASAPYFLDEGKLFVLDFYLKTAHEIQDVGDARGLWTGISWGGALWVTDGINIYQYSPGSNATVRYLGPFSKQGVPPSWASRGVFSPFIGADDSYRIIEFVPGAGDLFAVCRRFLDLTGAHPGTQTRILVFNGAGWSWYGPEIDGAIPHAAALQTASSAVYGRTLGVVTSASDNPEDRTLTYHNWRLPVIEETPTVGWKEAFEPGPLPFETGWIDGGFRELEGILYRMELDGFHLTPTETVRIEYRLNNAEDAAYKDLGTFTADQGVIWFDQPHQGVAFKTVQFRISLDRAAVLNSDVTRSPELKALVLLYDKRPQLRTAWTIRLDLNRMVERGMTIDGEPASIESAWQKLRELWNTPTLLKLVVPSLEGLGINVKMVDLPGTFDEIRQSRGGKGFVDIQLLEPVV